MKKCINFFTVFLVLASLAACKYATIVPDVPSPNVPVSFATDIQSIFNGGCTNCHRSGGQSPNLTTGNSYQSLMTNNLVVAGNAASSVLYQKVSIGTMSAYCDATSAGKIKNWINQGALNN
jgi:mono/diheme cytochrome c family protein